MQCDSPLGLDDTQEAPFLHGLGEQDTKACTVAGIVAATSASHKTRVTPVFRGFIFGSVRPLIRIARFSLLSCSLSPPAACHCLPGARCHSNPAARNPQHAGTHQLFPLHAHSLSGPLTDTFRSLKPPSFTQQTRMRTQSCRTAAPPTQH